ncbi:MAG: WD40/YVTN/BNR-like repeat-containing protein, partial [Acidimicrobiales bacterium]
AVVAGAAPGGTVVYAATASGRLFRSGDRARSFTELGEGLPAEEVRSLELSPRHADDATLWVSTWDSGVFRSTDDGETWDRMTEGLTTDTQADHVGLPQFRAVAAGLDGSDRLSLFVAGFDGLFRYEDGRGRWRPIETLTDYIVGLAVSPDFQHDQTIAVTTYVKGAFVSDDGGERWRFANDGLTVDRLGPGNKYAPLRRLHNVGFSPDYADDGTVFSASWVGILKSTDRGASWKEIEVSRPSPGEELRQFVLALSPSYASDHTVFAATRQGQVYRSEGGGEPGTWSQVGSLGERVRSLVVSPRYSDDDALYAGTVAGVYASGDGGRTWEHGPRMAARSRGTETDPGALLAISPSYGRDGTVFAGTDRGLLITRDAGRSWAQVVAAPLSGSTLVEAVAVSPDYRNDGTVLVSTRERGLLLSTDRAVSFRPVGTELLAANHLVADFSNPTSAPIQFSTAFATDRTVFAYAQAQVARSTDGGESWQLLELPGGADVLESLGMDPGANQGTARNGREHGWFETPIGNLSVRRVLAAAVVGMLSFVALTALGFGGRGRGRALALRLGGGVTILGVTLLALAQ